MLLQTSVIIGTAEKQKNRSILIQDEEIIMIDTLIRGDRYYRHNRWMADRMLTYRNALFRSTLQRAFRHSTFYYELYTAAGIRCGDLATIPPEQLPVITKDMVRDHLFEIATSKIQPDEVQRVRESGNLVTRVGRYTLVHTSGSTGKPCAVLYDRHALERIEANMVRLSIGGTNAIEASDFPIRTLYMASVGSGYAGTALAMNGIRSYRSISLIINVADPMDSWIDRVKGYDPNYLGGYPSCIRILADMQQEGKLHLTPKKIIMGGEPVSRDMCRSFRETFGADIINYYGCTESILIGIGANWYEGMYLADDMNYTEVDSSGRLIITPLYNDIFPLIRYQLNDVVEGFSRTPCGPLPYTHIDRILGRDEELMWFVNSSGERDFLHPLCIDDLDVHGIREYQFVRLDEHSLLLRCVKERGASAMVEEEIRQQFDRLLHRKNLQNLRYTIRFVDRLETDSRTGKTKLVISQQPPPR